MKKTTTGTALWVANLRGLMNDRGLNPRSLSLKAGLNATAVRDMLEGRTRFPRYDTVLALADALDVPPSQLMGGTEQSAQKAMNARNYSTKSGLATSGKDDDLELLVEIITRLQEIAEERGHRLEPRAFAAMATTLYTRIQAASPKDSLRAKKSITPHILDLLSYEALRA